MGRIFLTSKPSHIRRWRFLSQAPIRNWDNNYLTHICCNTCLITLPPSTQKATSRGFRKILFTNPKPHCYARGKNSSSDSWANIGAYTGDYGFDRSFDRRCRVNSTQWIRHDAVFHSSSCISCSLYVWSRTERNLDHGPSTYQLLVPPREEDMPEYN